MEFNAVFLSYQIDIGVMGEEIQRMELERKELPRRHQGKKKKVVVVEDDNVDSLPSPMTCKVVMMMICGVKKKGKRKVLKTRVIEPR